MPTYDWIQRTPVDSPGEGEPALSVSARICWDDGNSNVVALVSVGTFATTYAMSTWVWDGTNWTDVSPGTQPSARSGMHLAYDYTNGYVLAYAGTSPQPWTVPNFFGMLDDTWKWDGAAWTNLAPAAAPGNRQAAGMAHDPVNGGVLLFGGFKATVADRVQDTWWWNGTTWALKTPVAKPSTREYAAMTPDFANNNLVLFGGNDAPGVSVGDTWIWNGTNWVEQTPVTSPTARERAPLTYLSDLGVFLYGGSGTGSLIDTWIWDGTDWAQQSPMHNPGARAADYSLAGDEANGEVLSLMLSVVDAPTWVYTPSEPTTGVFMPATAIPIE